MIGTLFLLRALGADDIVGAALVCPSARYASVRWNRGERLERRFATEMDWQTLEKELANLQAGPLSARSTIVRLLASDRALAVIDLVNEEIPMGSPAEVATMLDACLNAQPLAEPTLRQERKPQ